jgi:adenylate cyclase
LNKDDSAYRVGEWVIDPRSGLASRLDEKIHLEPKAVELLSYLVSRPGEVVSRSELLDVVWPGVIVNDDAITNTVAKLRRSLHDDPKSPKLIETIPKRGYRIVASINEPHSMGIGNGLFSLRWSIPVVAALTLIAAVLLSMQFLTSGEVISTTESSLIPLPDKPSIAVLPFTNLSEDKEQEYFVDGMTEDLITDLSRVSALFVIARNSSFVYKGKQVDIKKIGRELGVRYIIEGSVRKIGTMLRINVQLIDADTGGHLWAERYDGEIENVFSLQDEILKKTVTALSVKLTGIEKNYASFQETHNPVAYQEFLKGWSSYRRETPEDFANAIRHFEKAVKEDPAYGRAYAALAAVYWESYRNRWHRRLGISPLSAVWQRVNEYLDKSMVAPTPVSHKVASAMLTTNRRYDDALIEAQRAIAIDPNDPLGYVAMAETLIFAGSPEKAEILILKAMRLDPNNPIPYLVIMGEAQLVKGAFTDAVTSMEQATRKNPDNRLAWMALISAYGSLGLQEKAQTALARLNELQNRDKLVSFTVANAREHWPFKTEIDRDRFLDGLHKAGVPEW